MTSPISVTNSSTIQKRLRVGLFIPCYIDMIFPEVGIATLQLLERFGLDVHFPLNQTCCGQPMSNSGDEANAAAAENLFVKNFRSYDYIVGPAGSCVKQVRCHFDTIEQTDDVRHVRQHTYELVEFLHDILQVDSFPWAEFRHSVALHNSCSSIRGLGIAKPSEIMAERILGIGDQGAGGLGISIGKLSLYTGIGGIRPERTLPIVLDVGTDNKQRLDDPEYLGWRHERITGQAYVDFVDQFVQAVKQEFPETCLQWEDFATPHARPILQSYRDQLLTFNDDIQLTAAVVLGAVLDAVNVTGKGLKDQQIVMLGAGGSGIGVADGLRAGMISEGLSEEEARSRFWIVDKDGLLHSGRNGLSSEQRVYARPETDVAGWPRSSNGHIGLADVIGTINATALIGFSTVGGAFSEPIVREMARKVERPIIFPLSNPTSKSEATAEDLIRWTDGRTLVASGSPFAPVNHNGREITIAQCNNVHIFPAMGLAVVASGARRVTDAMMQAAARSLAASSPALKDPSASLLSPLKDSRQVAKDIAVAAGIQAQKDGVAPNVSEDELRRRVFETQWTPAYPSFGFSV
jgi:malate dehydrogenase (oxaloacetate-decarboxylating)